MEKQILTPEEVENSLKVAREREQLNKRARVFVLIAGIAMLVVLYMLSPKP